MTSPDEPSAEPPLRILEAGQRLSASFLWDLQRTFFERQGAGAWSDGIVPQYITSNPWIANAYARVVLGWLRDGGFDLRFDLRQPVYILELGCGSGRFGYLFLNRLRDLLARSPFAAVQIRYVLTDFHEGTLAALRAHPALQDLIAEGALDFALYDTLHGGEEQEIRLLHSGEVLAPHTLRNPLAVVANYVFDSIPQDAFTVRDGELFDVRVIVKAPLPDEADLSDPAILDRVELEWAETSTPEAPEAPYGDPELDRILHEYAERLDSATFLFPCAALRSLRHLARLAAGRLLLLSGDKGYCQEELREGHEALGLTVHGSFSFAVNYHALGRWFVHRGGAFLSTSHVSPSLAVVAGLLGEPPGGSIETLLAFDEAVERTGPSDFFDLKKSLETAAEGLTLPQVLACVRFSGWDANILLGFFPVLIQQAREAPEPLRREIHRMVHEVWTTHFPVREPGDLPFQLGVLLCEIEGYADALPFFRESAGLYGPNAATLFNIALCLFHLGDLEGARANVDRAAELAPDYEPAAALREEIAAALQSR